MSYCGTALVRRLSEVAYHQLRTSSGYFGTVETDFNNFLNGTLITEAERLIDNYVGPRDGTVRFFNSTTGTMLLDGNGRSVLMIPPKYAPLIGLGTVTIDGNAITASNVYVYKQHIDYYRNTFNEGRKNISLVGSYGYATVPGDVEYICAQICVNALNEMARRFIATSQASESKPPDALVTMVSSEEFLKAPWVFTGAMKEQLDRYRIRWIDFG